MLNINNNLSSIIAQKSFSKSSYRLNQTIERLTTGYKLNNASDNAANFSISTAITTKMSSYFVAEENVLQGMDLVNAASSSISLVTKHLERIRELSIQAANGTYSETSLKAINTEVNARVDEIERIYASSEYNGIKFGGKDQEAKFIHNINRRDATRFKSFSNVKIDEAITSGTYSITTAEELAKLATMTNNGLISQGVEFVLGADINLEGYSNWTPIGNSTTKFSGVFDGNGYVISNVSINSSANQLGLFGRTSYAEIKNLGVENVNIVMTGATADTKHAAGVVGYLGASSTLVNCYVTGKIDARSQAKIIGGLAGQVYSGCTVDSCYSECNLVNMNTMAGNLLGCLEKDSVLKNSYSTGNVAGKSGLGGLVGVVLNNSVVENCYTTGNLSGNQSGGIAGSVHTNSSIINSWTSSEVTGTTTAGITYIAAGSAFQNVYVLDENNNHNSIFVATYRSGGSGDIVIKDCYYSDYYDDYSIPISGTNKTSISNVKSYDGEAPFLYDNQSNNYTLYPNIQLQVGIDASDASNIEVTAGYVLKDLKELRKIGLQSGDYVTCCDSLLLELNDLQLKYGSTQNRLESVLSEISVMCDNLISSRSTLRDSDIAKESSEYIRYQILQQASATILATANQSPAIALQLI